MNNTTLITFPFDSSSDQKLFVSGADQRLMNEMTIGSRILRAFNFERTSPTTFLLTGTATVAGAFADFRDYELDLGQAPATARFLVCRVVLAHSGTDLFAAEVPEPGDVIVADLSSTEEGGWTVAARPDTSEVVNAVISDAAVTANKLADSAVTTRSIQDRSVTMAKLPNRSSTRPTATGLNGWRASADVTMRWGNIAFLRIDVTPPSNWAGRNGSSTANVQVARLNSAAAFAPWVTNHFTEVDTGSFFSFASVDGTPILTFRSSTRSWGSTGARSVRGMYFLNTPFG